MKILKSRTDHRQIGLALALALALSLGMAGTAHAVTKAGSSNTATRTTATADTITTGTVTSIDVKRGVMAVSGKIIHFTAKGATFSDDRREPSEDGLEGLKAGDKVTVRSVVREGVSQAVQIVVKD